MDCLRESIYTSSITENAIYDSIDGSNSVSLVSDYVHNLANGIYKEFESLIQRYGENVVKNLMPMVVSSLETLDRVYSEKHNIEVEFELLKEDSGELMVQYEREKNQRKNAEENLFRLEDNYSEMSKKYEEEIIKLKSAQKMSEIRLKNCQEQISRFEKRDNERQSDYEKLLGRHHELIRFHRDHIDRSKNSTSESNKSFLSDKNSTKLKLASVNETKHNSLDVMDLDSKSTDSYNNETNLSVELGFNNIPKIPQYEWDFPPNISDDETCISETEEISTGHLTLDDELAGMGYEIESIIKENNDLIATKNALNIVKDDLISKLDDANSEIAILHHENDSLHMIHASLKLRVDNLESETKGLKQELIFWQNKCENDNDEENIPLSQRKKFTRLEMARVLMDRNMYKEKLLEMEEYVKWMKILKTKEKLSIWERFSRLFKTNPTPRSKSLGTNDKVNILNRHSRQTDNLSVTSNCSAVRDPNRQQINGWSLASGTVVLTKYDLPLPIYSRPLLENQSGSEITSAVAVNISGGVNCKGDKYVGSSIFYKNQQKTSVNEDLLEIEEKMNQGYSIKEYGKYDSLKSTRYNSESHVWICTSSDTQSQIIIVDANKPADCLETFVIPNSPVQCLGSVPGANSKDYVQKVKDVSRNSKIQGNLIDSEKSSDAIPQFKVTTGECIPFKSESASLDCEQTIICSDVTVTRKFNGPSYTEPVIPGVKSKDGFQKVNDASNDFKIQENYYKNFENSNDIIPKFKVIEVECIPFKSESVSLDSDNTISCSDVTVTKKFSRPSYTEPVIPDKISSDQPLKSKLVEYSSIQPTIWIGCQNGDLFVHPATGFRSHCLHHIHLSDSITNIIHQNSKVFVSLANGHIVIFRRSLSNDSVLGEWDMSKYHLLEPEKCDHSIRCLEPVTLTNKIWIGFRNQVLILDDSLLTISKSFEAHPRPDYLVRQLCCAGDGVWISLRLNTTIRLFHASNYQHLQDLNVEPHINKLIEPSMLGLALLRITCLSTSCHRIWIGTNKGMILSAPFINDNKGENQATQVEIVNELLDNLDTKAYQDNVCSPTFLPFINPEDLQLSYHGHRDAIKFFVSVRANEVKVNENQSEENSNNSKSDSLPAKCRYLVMSGGEGYRDFRLAENHLYPIYSAGNKKSEKHNGHLIVWQLSKKILE